MRTAVWIAIGSLAVTFWTSVASRIAPGGVFPDAAMVVVVFVALRREPMASMVTALALGYLVGRQALAPMGLHEVSMAAVALGVYALSGNLAGSGVLFFGFVAGAGTVAHHLLSYILLWIFRGTAGFSSWATAIGIFDGLVTATLALVSYPFMIWLDSKLHQERHEGLQWR